MLRTLLVGLAVVVGTVGLVSAQAPQGPDVEQIRTRQRIYMMEAVLERAVQLGVENLRRKVRAVMPDDALLQGGTPQARGFRLGGYGVFFDVEVPSLRRSLAWSLRTMNETGGALARDLAQMRAFMQAIADEGMRREFDRMLQRIQRQMTVPPVGPPLAPPPVTPSGGAPPDRMAAAQGATVSAQALLPAAGTPSPDPAARPQPDSLLLMDPSEAYTQEVKAALVDAMIENSGPLVLGPDEWLTVAARDNAPSNPLMPDDQDVVTLILRIKGSDLNAFRAGRLTIEQVKARVEATEF